MRVLFFLLTILLFCTTLSAGAAFAEARDKDDNATTWTFFVDDKMGAGKCGNEAKKILRKDGYGKVLSNASTKLNHGHWAVVFAYYEVKGKIRFRYGFGFSKASVKGAEKEAVKNLKKYDKKWKEKEHGYVVRQTNSF